MPAATTWTPAVDPTTLARATRHDMGSQRVYFYDLDTREEIKDHPLAGMFWTGSGPMVSHEGRYVDGTALVVAGAAYLDGTARRVEVTAESFPGRRVCAKVWYATSDVRPEWRILARGDGSRVLGRQPRVGAEWVAQFKAGAVA